MKTEWGFDQLLPLDTFTDPSNGYILDDCCVFEVHNGKDECVSMMKDPAKNTFTWNISKFSTIDKDFLFSEEFVVGERKWKLWFYPRGKANAKWKSSSVFLVLADSETLPSERKLYAEYKLRIKDQLKGNHFEKEVRHWFSASSNNWGDQEFMSLIDLNDTSKRFKLNDVVIVEAQSSSLVLRISKLVVALGLSTLLCFEFLVPINV